MLGKLFSRSVLLLLLMAASASSASSSSSSGYSFLTDEQLMDQVEHDDRELQIADCNVTLGIVTVEQVKALGVYYIQGVTTSEVETSAKIVFRPVEYDFLVMRLCSSCKFIDIYIYDLNVSVPYDYTTYCNETVYGYITQQSFLVFFPIDKTSQQIVRGYQIRPFLQLVGSAASSAAAPSRIWPSNFTTFLDSLSAGTTTVRNSGIAQLVPAMVAAGSGSVSIIPDYQGYGGISDRNRTFLWPTGYLQSALVGWLHTREFLDRYTDCSVMDMSHATVQGYEDGALGAVLVAEALQKYDTVVSSVFSSSGILDMDMLMVRAIRAVSDGTPLEPRLIELLELAAFSYSWGNPHLANTAVAGQELVSPTYRDAIFAKYMTAATGTTTTTTAAATDGTLAFLNADLVSYYNTALTNGVAEPCKANFTEGDAWYAKVGALCTAIAEASAYPTLLDQRGSSWNHPIEFCYSVDDPVIAASQVEGYQLPTEVAEARVYTHPYGTAEGTLSPAGTDHEQVMELCGVGTCLFYGLQNHYPDDIEMQPDTLTPLDDRPTCPQDVPPSGEGVDKSNSTTPDSIPTLGGDKDKDKDKGNSTNGGTREDVDEVDGKKNGTNSSGSGGNDKDKDKPKSMAPHIMTSNPTFHSVFMLGMVAILVMVL